MHSSVLILGHFLFWRIAQICNKKDLSFWAGATNNLLHTGWKLFLRTANEKKWESVHKFSTYVKMNLKTKFAIADFVMLKVVKKMKNKVF